MAGTMAARPCLLSFPHRGLCVVTGQIPLERLHALRVLLVPFAMLREFAML